MVTLDYVREMVRPHLPLSSISDSKKRDALLKDIKEKLEGVMGKKALTRQGKKEVIKYVIHKLEMRKVHEVPHRLLPTPISYERIYKYKGRSANLSVVPKSMRLLGTIESSTTLRVSVYDAIRAYLTKAQKKGGHLWDLVTDFRRIGTPSVYGSAHVVCLSHKKALVKAEWPVKVVGGTKDFPRVKFLSGMPEGLITRVPVSTLKRKGGQVIATAFPSPCLSMDDLGKASQVGLRSLATVPVLMAFKIEVSPDTSHANRVRKEAAFLALGNSMVKSRTCVNFPLVFEYEEAPCSKIFNPAIFDKPVDCTRQKTHFTLNELGSGDLKSWFTEIAEKKRRFRPEEVNGALLQCFISLYVVNEFWGITHHDAHYGNFLFNALPEPVDFVYDLVHLGIRLTLKNQRSLFKVWDFGLASKRRPIDFLEDGKRMVGMFSSYGMSSRVRALGRVFMQKIRGKDYGAVLKSIGARELAGVRVEALTKKSKVPTGKNVVYSRVAQKGLSKKAEDIVKSLQSPKKILRSRKIPLQRPLSRLRERLGSRLLRSAPAPRLRRSYLREVFPPAPVRSNNRRLQKPKKLPSTTEELSWMT